MKYKVLTNDEMTAAINSDLAAVSAGEIDFSEYLRRQKCRESNQFVPKLLEHRQQGAWQSFIDLALACPGILPLAFEYYDEVPDDMKYDFCTQAYTHEGDNVPAVRKAVRGALKYGKPNLPEEIADQKQITVYRAGEEPIEKAKYRISWTLDPDRAKWFLEEWNGRHACHLYKGILPTNKIIAYTNELNEHEIMQYANVHNIQVLS